MTDRPQHNALEQDLFRLAIYAQTLIDRRIQSLNSVLSQIQITNIDQEQKQIAQVFDNLWPGRLRKSKEPSPEAQPDNLKAPDFDFSYIQLHPEAPTEAKQRQAVGQLVDIINTLDSELSFELLAASGAFEGYSAHNNPDIVKKVRRLTVNYSLASVDRVIVGYVLGSRLKQKRSQSADN